MGVKREGGGAYGQLWRETVTLLCKLDLFPLGRFFCLLSCKWPISQETPNSGLMMAPAGHGGFWNDLKIKSSNHDFSYPLQWSEEEGKEGGRSRDSFKVMLSRSCSVEWRCWRLWALLCLVLSLQLIYLSRIINHKSITLCIGFLHKAASLLCFFFSSFFFSFR